MKFWIWLVLMVFFYNFARPIFWIWVSIQAVALLLAALLWGWVGLAHVVENIHRVRMRYSRSERRYKLYLS